MGSVKSFKDLILWQKSHQIVLVTYKLTGKFPSVEKFGLTDQVKRSAVSISSNIAEGFGRSTNKDKLHFLIMARGSSNELLNQLTIAKDLEFIKSEDLDFLEDKIKEVQKIISGLVKKLKGDY